MAPFIDGGRTVDRTNWSNTVISYYPFGGAIALALDLTLRDRSDSRAVARRLHAGDVAHVRQARRHAAKATSIVRTRSPTPKRRSPRSAATARSRATSSRATSRATTSPTTRGCSRAPASPCASATPGRAWLGDLRLESRAAARGSPTLVAPTWPIYARGLDQDDELQQLDGQRDQRRRRRRVGPARGTSRATRCRSRSSIAPASARTATRRRSPRIRTSRSCPRSSAAAR